MVGARSTVQLLNGFLGEEQDIVGVLFGRDAPELPGAHSIGNSNGSVMGDEKSIFTTQRTFAWQRDRMRRGTEAKIPFFEGRVCGLEGEGERVRG